MYQKPEFEIDDIVIDSLMSASVGGVDGPGGCSRQSKDVDRDDDFDDFEF